MEVENQEQEPSSENEELELDEEAEAEEANEMGESEEEETEPTQEIPKDLKAPEADIAAPKDVDALAQPENPANEPGESSNLEKSAEGASEEEEESDPNANNSAEEIDISQMIITSPEYAREIAEIILDQLEQDLYKAREDGRFGLKNKHLADPDLERARRKEWLRENISKASLVSDLSQLTFDLNAPSELELFYERGRNNCPSRRLKALNGEAKVDQAVQVKISRDIPQERGDQREMYTQTKEFAKVRREIGQREYRRMYPLPEDWEEPLPATRQGSLKHILEKVAEHDPSEDNQHVGPKPKYKKAQKARLLPPILGNYQKTETYWTGSSFSGDFKDRMFDLGRYDYPTYATYQSEFKEGQISSKKHFGIVTYPRGDTFEGTWKNGRFIDGQITFADGLKFDPMGWRYCTAPDRRFFKERSEGVRGIGGTRFSDRVEQPKIPYGCYDVGDGVYNPDTGIVVNYKGVLLRKATEYEHRWIVLNCRKTKLLSEIYEPCFSQGKTPDSYARYYPSNT